MSKPINLVLFGDQTVEKLSSIRSLVRNSKSSAGAARLLREATDALQLNFAKLAKEDRNWNHEIHTLLGLAEDNVSVESRNEVIATVLMCIGRLGELILYAEEDPTILGSEHDPVQVLAFCTGLLPAAALVAAKDTSELFDIGIEIISVTFRMACEISRRCRVIEDTKHCWATTVVGVTREKVQPILDKFHAVQKIPYPKRIAIGVISNRWLTLIGAPSSLSRLMEFSKELDQAPKIPTDTDGAVHTDYIPRFDIDKVLGNSPLLDTPITSKARIISPASCEVYTHASLRSLLAEIMIDIAHNVLHINQTIEECVSGLIGKGPVNLAVAGPTGHLAAVERVFQNNQVEYHYRQHQSPQFGIKSRAGSDLIAIVGMSGRFPGSDTVESFFEDLLKGNGQIQKIPKSRFSIDDHYDSAGKRRNTTSTRHGAFLDHPGHFDNRLFNISPREAKQMDPIQRLLLMTSYEALESAGYSKNASLATESNRIATYFGQASEDWRDVLNNSDIDIYHVPSISRPFGPSRLGYHHKWGGGTYALDAACATSTTAIHLACSALKSRECDTALAGGGSILVSPYSFAGLSRSGMISNNGGCRTFHDDADGYVRGEGIGVVVLKRLEDADADNDNIIGIIRGSARTYTSTSTSITHPSAKSQSRIYEDILRQTAVVPNEIAYVEMHGTGTQAGDFEEMTSVINVMGQGRSRENMLTVGAVKANVGHGEGAAGVTSLIKVLMMMQQRKIPPQPGIPFKLNHRLPKLEPLHVQIAGLSSRNMALKPSSAATDKKIKCVVNSFDASGGNTSLVVEEAPSPIPKGEIYLPCFVVSISAKTTMSLKENRRRLLDYLVRNPDTKLADIAYTTTARRMHEAIRVAYTAKTTREITSIIRKEVVAEVSNDPKMKPPTPHVIFAFTGQGSQYVGMGKQFFQHSSLFRELLHIYQQMACYQGLPTFLHLITGEMSNNDDASAICVQLAIVALEIATAHLLKIWGIIPDVVIGHSLGEYSALCVAGVLSVSDTLFLVGRRAQLMENNLTAGDYAMLAISLGVKDVRQLIQKGPGSLWSSTEIACVNAPQSTVVSGPAKEIEDLRTKLEEEACQTTQLNVPYGFHSGHVEAVLEDFYSITRGIAFSAPVVPIVSTLMGEVIPAGKIGVFTPSYLSRQARERVNFVGAIEACEGAGFAKLQTHWIEVGPEPVCIGLVRKILGVPSNRLLCTMKSKEDNWVTISSTFATLYSAGASINWPQYYAEFKSSLSLINIPTYAFDLKEFWTPFIEHVTSTATSPNASDAMLRKHTSTPAVSNFSSTSLQWVEEELLEKGNMSVTFASHASEPNLYAAIRGHIVNSNNICSLSIFCDMAKSAAQYAYKKLNSETKAPTMSIHNIEMTHALVVPEPDPRLIVMTKVSYPSSGKSASVTFQSVISGIAMEHGSCEVVFEEISAWSQQMFQTSFLVRARIESLKNLSTAGKAHRLLKPVIYKLFSNLVAYSKDYQGMEEIWVDNECHDAVGTIVLPRTTASGNFLYNPYWMDTSIHLSGFLLNGGLKYPEDIACLSTGFQSWQLTQELLPDKTYTTYVSMQELETPNMLSGSAYIYDDKNELIQVTTGIRFLKMKKVVLNSVICPDSSMRKNKSVVKFGNNASALTKPKTFDTGYTTSETHSHDNSSDENEPTSHGAFTPASSIGESGGVNLLDAFLAIVSSESAFSIEDMSDDTTFADMGVDSLMAITILAAVQKDTGVELPATFFLDNPTVGNARSTFPGVKNSETIFELSKKVEKAQGSPKPMVSAPKELDQKPVSNINQKYLMRPTSPLADIQSAILPTSGGSTNVSEIDRESKAILLQGSSSSKGSKIFLLPDGSGSPARYVQIPAIDGDVNIYALESPFLKTPLECTWTFKEMCDLYFAAMKNIQAKGPYILAGFSLGAVYAYEIAQRLIKNSEHVSSLILIDMAVPAESEKAAFPSEDELKDAGIIKIASRSSKTQKAHVTKTVHMMMKHDLSPCLPDQRPKKTVFISSKTASAANGQSVLTRWLQRSSSVLRGWEEVVGSVEKYKIEVDHFSLFKPPAVKIIRDHFVDALINSTSGEFV